MLKTTLPAFLVHVLREQKLIVSWYQAKNTYNSRTTFHQNRNFQPTPVQMLQLLSHPVHSNHAWNSSFQLFGRGHFEEWHLKNQFLRLWVVHWPRLPQGGMADWPPAVVMKLDVEGRSVALIAWLILSSRKLVNSIWACPSTSRPILRCPEPCPQRAGGGARPPDEWSHGSPRQPACGLEQAWLPSHRQSDAECPEAEELHGLPFYVFSPTKPEPCDRGEAWG